MSFVTYLVVKQKFQHYKSLDYLISKNACLATFITLYFTGLGGFRRYYRKHM